ncbi:MAG: hypothetical protein K6G88_12420 [Lachnospiraceae bacterium]|nr:hypothetical protein [Lachnospiraceae bacterium]
MRKFMVMLCSVALMAGTITPVAPVTTVKADAYEEDGDLITNPFGDRFEEETPTEESEVFAITSQPQNVEVEPGEYATFSVGATGKGLTYQWYYATATGSYKALSGATQSSVRVKIATSKYNGYRYKCAVKDASGATKSTNAATVTIIARTPLEIVSQPQDVVIESAQTVTFHVETKGVEVQYQWQYYVPSSGEWKKLTQASAKTDTFSMDVTGAFNGYKYRCFIKDAVGTLLVTDPAYIYVKQDFAINLQPTNQYALAGDSATFAAGATGTGLKFQWQYCTASGSTWKNLTGSAAQGKQYTITKVSSAFNGYKYRCVITDFYGQTKTTNVAVVKIVTGTTIISQPQNVTVKAGNSASFTVEAEGPGITYQWQYCTASGSTWKNLSGAASQGATYTITKATSTFNGYKYRCVITDKTGQSVTSNPAVVTVQ